MSTKRKARPDKVDGPWIVRAIPFPIPQRGDLAYGKALMTRWDRFAEKFQDGLNSMGNNPTLQTVEHGILIIGRKKEEAGPVEAVPFSSVASSEAPLPSIGATVVGGELLKRLANKGQTTFLSDDAITDEAKNVVSNLEVNQLQEVIHFFRFNETRHEKCDEKCEQRQLLARVRTLLEKQLTQRLS